MHAPQLEPPSRQEILSLTVLFDAVGFKTLDLELVHERGVLEPTPSGVGGNDAAAS